MTVNAFLEGGATYAPILWSDKACLGYWRGGTVLEVSEPVQQTKYTKDKSAPREPLFWLDGKKKMQIIVRLQTSEHNPADPDDTGIRNLFVPNNGRAPGSLFVVIGDACRAVGSGPDPGGELYVRLVGSEPSKGGEDRNIFEAQYKVPVKQFFAEPAAQQAPPASNGQQHPAIPTPQGVFQSPPAQQPFAPAAQPQGRQQAAWPPGGQAYQPPPVDPRNPFGQPAPQPTH